LRSDLIQLFAREVEGQRAPTPIIGNVPPGTMVVGSLPSQGSGCTSATRFGVGGERIAARLDGGGLGIASEPDRAGLGLAPPRADVMPDP
jgi:hypothetical protein